MKKGTAWIMGQMPILLGQLKGDDLYRVHREVKELVNARYTEGKTRTMTRAEEQQADICQKAYNMKYGGSVRILFKIARAIQESELEHLCKDTVEEE